VLLLKVHKRALNICTYYICGLSVVYIYSSWNRSMCHQKSAMKYRRRPSSPMKYWVLSISYYSSRKLKKIFTLVNSAKEILQISENFFIAYSRNSHSFTAIIYVTYSIHKVKHSFCFFFFFSHSGMKLISFSRLKIVMTTQWFFQEPKKLFLFYSVTIYETWGCSQIWRHYAQIGTLYIFEIGFLYCSSSWENINW